MDKDEVRACLRALLSSTVFSYSLKALLHDFRVTTGFEMPLFGCANAVEFLRTLGDTVQLVGDPSNPQVALVESKKSAHITSLVDRQKINVTYAKNRNLLFRHKRLIVPDKNKTFNGANYMYMGPSSFPQRSSVETVTSQSKIYKFGSSFQSKPKEPELESPFYFGASIPRQEKQKESTLLKAEGENCFSGKSSSTPDQENKVAEKGNERTEKAPAESNGKKTESSYFEDFPDNENPYENTEDCRRNKDSVVNEGIQNKLRKLIQNYPDGLWCHELPQLFLEEYNVGLDYKEFGYTSLIQMLSELTDVFRCIRPGNGDWILFDASVPPGPIENKMKYLELGAEINCEIKRNVQKLLFNFFETESQMELNKILDLYQEMFGSCLDFESLGFKDLRSLLETWEGSFLNLLHVDGKTFIVPGLTRTSHSAIRWEEAVPPITAENDIFAEIFPKEVVGPDESPSELDLTRHVAVGNVVDVCIAEVWTPNKFYLQLNKFKKHLNRFMDDLQNFYNEYLNKYKMPDSTIRPNQICVGLYNSDPEMPEEWHRAQIVKVINEKVVLINFLDFGTLARVKKSQLRFLHRSFQSFPVQAFLAQLSGVVPPNNELKWPLSTSKKFLELTRVPYLKAEIIDIDFKVPCLSVALFDPAKKSSVSINQKLIKEKLAWIKEPGNEEPFPGVEVETDTKPQDSSLTPTQQNSVRDKSEGQSAQGNSKNLPEQTDQFSDIADLGQTTLFQFKMKSLSLKDSELRQKKSEAIKTLPDSNVSFEFEEVPDLEKTSKEKVLEEKLNKEIPKSDLFESEENPPALKTGFLLQQKVRNSHSAPEETVKKLNPPIQVATKQMPSVLPNKPNRLPPGLENVNILPNFNEAQFYLQTGDFKKRVNILAMEFLATKRTIKQVGMTNPGLALEIATEMAELYLASQCHRGMPYGLETITAHPFANGLVSPFQFQPNVFDAKEPAVAELPVFPVNPPDPKATETNNPVTNKQDFMSFGNDRRVNSVWHLNRFSQHHRHYEKQMKSDEVEKPLYLTFAEERRWFEVPEDNQQGKAEIPAQKEKNVEECVKVKQICNKTLHLVTIDEHMYFCAEEIVRSFTLISNREIADKVLHMKKFQTNYRIITKHTNEKVVNAIKNSDLPVFKGKSKKLRIYLIPVAEVVPLLQALGCMTKSFEKDLMELQLIEKERINRRKGGVS